MRTLNFLGYIVIIIILFFLYSASERGPFIYQNSTTHNIKITRDTFEPNDININLGDQVIWKNYDYVLRHTVVNDDPLLRNSDVLLKGDEFKIIFDRPGEYIFYSSLYPEFEKGIIRVKQTKSGSKFRKDLQENVLTVVLRVYKIFLKILKKYYNILQNFIKSKITIKNIIYLLGTIIVLLISLLIYRFLFPSSNNFEININRL